MNRKYIDFINMVHLRGPNIWAYRPVIEALVDIGVVEKRRGLGMFVKTGAREQLLAHEREKFLTEDWPRIAAQIAALDLDLETLIAKSVPKPSSGADRND